MVCIISAHILLFQDERVTFFPRKKVTKEIIATSNARDEPRHTSC
jgi:hypothetical protein